MKYGNSFSATGFEIPIGRRSVLMGFRDIPEAL
jgi:hypothetical protein